MSWWERLTPLLEAHELRFVLILLATAIVVRFLVHGPARRRAAAAVAVLAPASAVDLLPRRVARPPPPGTAPPLPARAPLPPARGVVPLPPRPAGPRG